MLHVCETAISKLVKLQEAAWQAELSMLEGAGCDLTTSWECDTPHKLYDGEHGHLQQGMGQGHVLPSPFAAAQEVGNDRLLQPMGR